MNSPIIRDILYLVSNPDNYGRRRIISRIAEVEKPAFPRTGQMGKKGLSKDWNGYVSPFCIWYSSLGGYRWYSSLEDALRVLQQSHQNEIYNGAIFMDAEVYAREQAEAEQLYLNDEV